jgi:uncharacterized protein
LANLLLDRTVRLAVTGLSGAGKTVFITSVIHNLLSAAHRPSLLPLLGVQARSAVAAAQIISGATLSRPLFPYAEAIAAMAGTPPTWPEGTRDISQIRVAIRYRPEGIVSRQLGRMATLGLDIIDYPGEWLIDLPMLEQSFAQWSAGVLALCRQEPRRSLAADWLGFLKTLAPEGPADESKAREAAARYTDFLRRCKEPRHGLSLVQPGRFVLPGAYEGAPILWFCPLEGAEDMKPARGSLRALMESRYDAYRREIVRKFYREHFRTFDRQIVLVDLLRALDGGRHAFEDARAALTAILGSFDFGRPSWLAPLLGSRIDRVLFAATKADHVTPDQYGNLRSLLGEMMAAPSLDMRFAGGSVAVRALAAVRCTEVGRGRVNGREVGMIRGIPVGESRPRLLYPGEVPASPPPPNHWETPPAEFPDFRPPSISAAPVAGIPHIGLDEALEFLIGDKFR